MITEIENYYLNQPVREAPDLTELAAGEYLTFEATGIKRILKDEKIYHGHDINFNGSVWNTVIGATEGKIYKIAIYHMGPDKNESNVLFKQTLDYLVKEMGKYNEHTFLPNRDVYIWDAPEGNFIYEQLSKIGQYGINIFITSSSIRKQVPNREIKTNR
jgi:hypothetical protein